MAVKIDAQIRENKPDPPALTLYVAERVGEQIVFKQPICFGRDSSCTSIGDYLIIQWLNSLDASIPLVARFSLTWVTWEYKACSKEIAMVERI